MSAAPNAFRRRAPSGRPVILLTPDLVETGRGPTEREYGLRTNYADAVAEAGGVALIVPLDVQQLPDLLDLADGFIISGSGPGAEVAEQRLAFERSLITHALGDRKPLLGICHGMQLIGEHLGGRIMRDLPELALETTPHLPNGVPDALAHDVDVLPNSLLAKWSGDSRVKVNSLHRHILIGFGGFRVTARAADGVTEAIEGLGDSFCLGVQWHPEYRLTAFDRRILEAFVAACRENAGSAGGATGGAPAATFMGDG